MPSRNCAGAASSSSPRGRRSLTQPLFHAGALRARQRQYQENYEAAVAQYRQTVLTAFQSVADTLAALDDDAKELDQTERAARLGDSAALLDAVGHPSS